MISACICTIGDEILIGQIVDTNSSMIARALQDKGIAVRRMVSFGDDGDAILSNLDKELNDNDIIIVTGGLGPTKDDITRDSLRVLSGSRGYRRDAAQEAEIRRILSSRGLDALQINLDQALVPDNCEIIVNHLGTAPIIIVSRDGHRLYSMPGVPYETAGALGDVLSDIDSHFSTEDIYHKTIMTYGIAESALSNLIAPWEDALPEWLHLSYLPDPITGVRLRLSAYGCDHAVAERAILERLEGLKEILGSYIYSMQDDSLQAVVGRLLKERCETLSAAESCTGGEIAHLLTTVSGSSAYFLGSVTSYAIEVKQKVLAVPAQLINEHGVVSSEVAAAMAESVRRLTGSTWAVATTGLAEGDDDRNPEGTVWVGISGPNGTFTSRWQYKSSRQINIKRFAATALNELRLRIINY